MSHYELSHQQLIEEQAAVQQNTDRSRSLDDYNYTILSGCYEFAVPRMSAVTDFLGGFVLEDTISLESVLEGISASKPDQTVHWVDMGGGYGLAQRQFASLHRDSRQFATTNVDALEYDLGTLNSFARQEATVTYPGFADESAAPRKIQANAETVILPAPADIITSVEMLQYLSNPLRGISHWYNQLADGGLLIVASERNSPWTDNIVYSDEVGRGSHSQTPTHDILQELRMHDINFAATEKADDRSGHRPELDPRFISSLVLQKRPGSTLELVAPVVDMRTRADGYKTVRYERPANSASPLQVQSRPR